MNDLESIIQNFIADDKELIIYHPELREITKTITSAILLAQILYWDKETRKKGKTKFCKFKAPPKSKQPKYKEGSSWCEELRISPKEFDGAIKNIGSKYSKKTPKNPKSFIWYNIDINRITWYEVNREYLHKALKLLYAKK